MVQFHIYRKALLLYAGNLEGMLTTENFYSFSHHYLFSKSRCRSLTPNQEDVFLVITLKLLEHYMNEYNIKKQMAEMVMYDPETTTSITWVDSAWYLVAFTDFFPGKIYIIYWCTSVLLQKCCITLLKAIVSNDVTSWKLDLSPYLTKQEHYITNANVTWKVVWISPNVRVWSYYLHLTTYRVLK